MSNPTDLRVSRSLELLASLRQTTAQFAKREDQLTRTSNTKRFAAARNFRETSEHIETELAAGIAQAELDFTNEQGRYRAMHERHSAWIERARSTGIRTLPKRAQAAKERWIGTLQMRHFQADRRLESENAAVDSEFAHFSAALAQQDSLLAAAERRALNAFRGYGAFRRLLRSATASDAPQSHSRVPCGERDALLNQLITEVNSVREQLRAFSKLTIPHIFSAAPLPVLIPLMVAGTALIQYTQHPHAVDFYALGGVALAIVGIVAVHSAGSSGAKAAALKIAEGIAAAKTAQTACREAAQTWHEEEKLRIKTDYEQTCAEIASQWGRADEVEKEFAQNSRTKIETQAPRAAAWNDEDFRKRLLRIAAARDARVDALQTEAAERLHEVKDRHEQETATLQAEEASAWSRIETEWTAQITPLYKTSEEMISLTAPAAPPWSAEMAAAWKPADNFASATQFGTLEVDLASGTAALPKSPRLALPGSSRVAIPVALTFPAQGSLLFETTEAGGGAVIESVNNIILRLLATTPPGKLSFTIIDPVGLGQNFGGLMPLTDYEENLINRRIWTQREQIEERLAELCEHIEKVIQMYLRNQYATISEYNEQAGSVAEKYHFLVIADFPANFSETAVKRLQSIVISGPRCGIFTLIHWDQRHAIPEGLSPDDLRKNSVCIRHERNTFTLSREQIENGATLRLDQPPEPELALALVNEIGKASIDSNRVQVPFTQIAPAPAELWTHETTNELRIAIGRTGATKLQYLAIGKGTKQHALFAGKTGSGKSTLFHVIITNLALACSPEQVEFYLIDFKKGVEFKCYAEKRLPHARVIAIESDREFALSVLQRVDEELRRRGDMFRKLGVQDIAGYKREGGKEPVPRSLLIIDEFQEFFVEDDSIAQTASVLFDRIVRQGRAFGIHVLLGSQTLGGAYSLARATLGQMVIRVALQCNEADAYLIMDDTNSAPRLLSRPGEGIYNDAAGAVEGNSPFQVVWLPDQERDDWLDTVQELADQHGPHSGPIVFEGNAPADIGENELLRMALQGSTLSGGGAGRAWLGAPNSIKGPTEAVFHRQSGNHLLIVGQREEAALTMLGVSMLALAAQYPVGRAKFLLLDSTNPGSPDSEFLEEIVRAIPHGVTVARGQEINGAMAGIADDLKNRSSSSGEAADAPAVFLFINGLHRFKKLRHEEDFSFSMSDSDAQASPGAQFNDLVCEGSSHGMHIITTVDTFNNVNRFLSRKALSEFGMRVVFQMSANDSASLVDSPKASGLGLHRALFYSEHEGSLETFRPYATPSNAWLKQAGAQLTQRQKASL